MAAKSDNGEGSGEHAALPEWNSGETEMLRSLFLEEAEKHVGRITEAQKSLARASSATLDISPEVVDVLFDGERKAARAFRHPRIDTRHTHGTGCTLSAAIAAHLALGLPLERAVEASLDFVYRAIAAAPGLGGGRGPLNHFA